MVAIFVTLHIPKENSISELKTLSHMQEVEMSRVPCVGEFIRYKGCDYQVTKVIHNLDFDSRSSLATINPEAFIDVSLCDL